MKKAILLIVTFFLFLCCKSQTRRTELGLRGGINLGSLFGPGTDYAGLNSYKKNYFSGVVGLQFRYRISKEYALNTFVQFEQNTLYLYNRTLVDHSGYPYGQGDEISKLSYLNIPITVERYFGNKLKFNLNAGLFVGVLVEDIFVTKVKQRFIPAGQPPTLEVFKTKTNNDNLMNFGLSIGAGVSIPVTKKINIGLNFQNNLGLINVTNIYNYSAYNVKTNSISFLTGILFSI